MLVLAVVVAAGLAGVALAQEPAGDEILDSAEQQYEDAETVVGTAEVVVENESESVRATVEFAAADGNSTRLRVTDTDRTVVVGTNGSVAWTYQPATGFVQAAEDGAQTDRVRTRYADRLDRFEANLTATRTGTETVGGTETYVLNVTSTNESITATGQLWVAKDDWSVQKSVLTGDNVTVTVTTQEQQFNVSVHESTFRPPSENGTLAPGAERETYTDFDDAQAETDLSMPDLRGTYTFEEALAASYDDTSTATATYDTDDGSVSVAVSDTDDPPFDAGNETTVAGQNVTTVETDRATAVYWTGDGTTTGVVTRGPLETALDVAESVIER